MKTIRAAISGFVHRLLLRVTRNRPARVIADDYLLRYFVGQFFGWTIYLHQFLSGDAERHLHNHPFHVSAALVLRGRYEEERLRRLCPVNGPVCDTRLVKRFNRIRPLDFHRIVKPVPNTWTLFALRRDDTAGWGFLERNNNGLIYFRAANDGAAGGDRWWRRAGVVTGGELRRRLRTNTKMRQVTEWPVDGNGMPIEDAA